MNEFLEKKRSRGDYGRQESLPPSLRSKMSKSFGMDLRSVKLYRSDEMAGTGMQGLASGNRVILSREIDLNTMAGQAVLGHELSHIHAQNQGIGTGRSGLYSNAALERRADAEGLMAAHGQPIFGEYAGMNPGAGMEGFGILTPLSGGLPASAGAPMQAKKPNRQNDASPATKPEGAVTRRRVQKEITRTDLSDEEKRDVELYARYLTQTNVVQRISANPASSKFDNIDPGFPDDDICAILYEKEKAVTFVWLNLLDKEDLMENVRSFKPDPKAQKVEILQSSDEGSYENLMKKYKEEDPSACLTNIYIKEEPIDMSFDGEKGNDLDDESIDIRNIL